MSDGSNAVADSTAVRVALWRAIHVQVDAPPHVLEDEVGLRLVAPEDGWRSRPDMDPQFTRPFRASIVARARFIEDLVVARANGTPFISFFTPPEMLALAREAGFREVRHVSALVNQSSLQVAIEPSRRTPAGVRTAIAQSLYWQ